MSCCGSVSRPQSVPAKQFDVPTQNQQQTVKQQDSGNPVNNIKSTNVVRANEVNRNNYHQQHFGGR